MYEEAGKNTDPSAVWRVNCGCSHVIAMIRGIRAIRTEIITDGH